MKCELIKTIAVANTLGEGVTWDPRTGNIWWTDIQESKLYRLHLDSDKMDCYKLPERLGAFGLTDDINTLVCAFESGFALYQPEAEKLTAQVNVEPDWLGTRLNDGRLDPQGRFWAGTMIENTELQPPNGASIYSYAGGKIKRHIDGLTISNGLAWSVDGKTLYYSDSPKRTIYACKFGINTTLTNKRIFASTPEGAYPDGAIVDSDNHLWSAHWGAGQVVRYSPTGKIDFILPTPASQPSCVAFAGRDMNYLLVTSAREGLSETSLVQEPEAGNLFIYKTDFNGIVANNYYKLVE